MAGLLVAGLLVAGLAGVPGFEAPSGPVGFHAQIAPIWLWRMVLGLKNSGRAFLAPFVFILCMNFL